MSSITEQDLSAARNLLRLAAKSTGYLEGYNDSIVDAWKWLRQEGHIAIAEQFKMEVSQAITRYPVKWPDETL